MQYTEHSIIRKMALVVVSLLIILFCVFALSTVTTAKHAKAAQRNTLERYESVRVVGGDSLWTIAEKYRGKENTADFVKELKILNSLSSDRIEAGSYLLVPVSCTL
jgi:hypothetical protein